MTTTMEAAAQLAATELPALQDALRGARPGAVLMLAQLADGSRRVRTLDVAGFMETTLASAPGEGLYGALAALEAETRAPTPPGHARLYVAAGAVRGAWALDVGALLAGRVVLRPIDPGESGSILTDGAG